MPANIQIVRDAPKVGRRTRSPKHTFHLKDVRPFQIQPHFIAPVWPGETMKNMLVQAKCEGPFVGANTVGWWFEQYYFYVKHRDLRDRDVVLEMHLDPAFTPSTLYGAANPKHYAMGEGDWVGKCLRAVVEEYFRDEGEDWDEFMFEGLPLAALNHNTIMDSLKDATITSDHVDSEIPGENPVIPDGVPAGFTEHFAQWEAMRGMQLTDATFEDYLKSYGVKVPRELKVDEIHKPELLRYVRDWTYPTVSTDEDANSGFAPRWNIAERADKDRYFAEPGFLFGVTVMRPKVYYGAQRAAGVNEMLTPYAWLPAVLLDQEYTSLKKIASGSDAFLLNNTGHDLWVDLRDLAVHGDQFLNFDPVEDAGLMTSVSPFAPMLPDPESMQRRYPSNAMITALQYVDGSLGEVDGQVSMSILGRLTDTSL